MTEKTETSISYAVLVAEAVEDHTCVEYVEGRECRHIAALRELARICERAEEIGRRVAIAGGTMSTVGIVPELAAGFAVRASTPDPVVGRRSRAED